MIQFFRMINQCSRRCFTVMQILPPSRLVCKFRRPQDQSFGTQSSTLEPLKRHLFTRHRSDLPKTCYNLSFEFKGRQMSSLPPTVPPVIHHADKQEFTLAIPGHQPAYLRYTRSPDSMTMYTTVVPDSLGGRGVAKLLADEAFNFAVKEQVGLKLTCWYLSGYLKRHPRADVCQLLLD